MFKALLKGKGGNSQDLKIQEDTTGG